MRNCRFEIGGIFSVRVCLRWSPSIRIELNKFAIISYVWLNIANLQYEYIADLFPFWIAFLQFIAVKLFHSIQTKCTASQFYQITHLWRCQRCFLACTLFHAFIVFYYWGSNRGGKEEIKAFRFPSIVRDSFFVRISFDFVWSYQEECETCETFLLGTQYIYLPLYRRIPYIFWNRSRCRKITFAELIGIRAYAYHNNNNEAHAKAYNSISVKVHDTNKKYINL